jgi:surface protein
MFLWCNNLTTIDLSHFNTDNVTDMSFMFSGCSKLEILDLGSFSNAKLNNIDDMFDGCCNLKTIFVSDKWSKTIDGRSAFADCSKLIGGMGTDGSTGPGGARIDEGVNKPGFFTKAGTKPYVVKDFAVYKDGTLTFYYDVDKPKDAEVFRLGRFWSINDSVKKVVFDPSFKKYAPESSHNWFGGMTNLTEIVGMKEYLNTSNVKDMSYMFSRCASLETLDLSMFDTHNVTNMEYMVRGCSKLKTIYVGYKWTVINVHRSYEMFDDCDNLVGGLGTKFKRGNVQEVEFAHIDGDDGTPGFFTRVGGGVKTRPYVILKDSVLTFYYGIDMTGEGKQWKYYTDDNGAAVKKAVFAPSCKNYKPLDLSNLFSGCVNMTEIVGMEKYLNTSECINMKGMFSNCQKIKVLDLGHFDTREIAKHYGRMDYMFSNCINLRTIFVNDKFKAPDHDINYVAWDIFENCIHLCGGNGTTIHGGYPCIDGSIKGNDRTPGLFTKVGTKPYVPKEYAVYKDCTLTLYYDKPEPQNAQIYYIGLYDNEVSTKVQKVVFDQSFRNFAPKSCSWWFNNFVNLKEIVGIKENLNTKNIEDMSRMFSGCTSLETIDLSGLQIPKLNKMNDLFYGCVNLKNINLNDFYSEQVLDIDGMFWNCKSIETFDFGIFKNLKIGNINSLFYGCSHLKTITSNGFNAEKITTMKHTFADCTLLADIDLSAFKTAKIQSLYKLFENCKQLKSFSFNCFDTKNVHEMDGMFSGCTNLGTVDMSEFQSTQTIDMYGMFNNCINLKTIFVSEKWNVDSVKQSSYGIFNDCKNLFGGMGTRCDDSGHKCARIDGGEKAPGYFTDINAQPYVPKEYAVYNDGTLTFYYNENRPQNARIYNLFAYHGITDSIQKVVFDPSFKQYAPKSCAKWFRNMKNLKEIVGMKENLNTENVEDMSYMFDGCTNLENIDLSGFSTAQVRDMSYMFRFCQKLKAIFVSHLWNIDSVKKGDGMFLWCNKLYGGKGTHEWSAKIEYAHIDGGKDNPGLFTEIGQPAYDPDEQQKIAEQESAIQQPEKQQTSQQTPKNSVKIKENKSKRLGYAVLNDSTLTFYSGKKVPNGAFAINDKRQTPLWNNRAQEIKKVVFSKSFAKYRPTSCYEWFSGCCNLEQIVGMSEYLNTSEVNNMAGMFMFCCNLKEVDLSGFKTDSVKTMHSMFSCCKSLQSLDLSSFNTSNVRNMALMFEGCDKLSSLDLSNFNTSKVENMGSMFFGCRSIENLDLKNFNTSACGNMSYMFGECTKLKSVDVSSFDTRNTEDNGYRWGCQLEGMFEDCESLTDLDVSHFAVFIDNLKGMFFGCSNLKNLKLFFLNLEYDDDYEDQRSGFCGDLSGMFCGCKSLESLDLSSWHINAPRSLNRTFADCINLKTIYVSRPWRLQYRETIEVETLDGEGSELRIIDNPSDFYHVFYNCPKLIGGGGTKWKYNDVSSPTYLKIDSGDSEPGYFTEK